jgi:SpoVK/Ycf46/Vps4 family AAA+-type ATPase
VLEPPPVPWTQVGLRIRSRRTELPRSGSRAFGHPAVAEFALPRSGQLLLSYGPPGTGKPYAIHALGWEWRRWCELHYVVDPEVFFGQRADYMVDVLLEDDQHFDLDELGQHENTKWRLLVLEDSGELLALDAKERTGQGLSRLLNLVDGIVGQGLRLLVLVTTNEPLRRLHPAVGRPGRCAARVEFGRFSPSEARAWLRAHDAENPHSESATLAELFARRSGEETESHPRVGFGA